MKKLIALLRYLVLFKKPVPIAFDFIDVIIVDKPVFLISWKLKNGYKVKIKPFNQTYKKQEVSLLLKLPAGTSSVQVIFCNFWRRSTRTIRLKHTQLDKRTASYLIQQFYPVSYLEVTQGKITVERRIPTVKKPPLQLKPVRIYPSKNLKVQSEKLKYYKL